MEINIAIKALAALAHETRLTIFRMLVQAGESGVPAGHLAKELGIPNATLSFHLKARGGRGGGTDGARTRLERGRAGAAGGLDRLALRGALVKTLAVINPKSAGGKTGRDTETIARKLAEVTGPLTVALTNAPMDAARITSHALRDGYGRVVAVGGDGTINEVVNGFFSNGVAINPVAEFALLNLGTGGDFRKTFDIDAGLEASLERIAGGRVRQIDVGRLSFVTADGQSGTRHFANIASFGMSGDNSSA